MGYIRIQGTDYNPELYVPTPDGKSTYSGSYYQQHYIWELDNDGGKNYNNMKDSFAYDNWPLSIYSRPSENGILKSNSQKGTRMLSFFCLHIWHFTYDISYPVMSTIFDQETKTNKAYRFNFPFKVSIDHNQPNRFSTGSTLFDSNSEISSEDISEFESNKVEPVLTLFGWLWSIETLKGKLNL